MSSGGSSRFVVSSSRMCDDLELEDQLDYEPDDQGIAAHTDNPCIDDGVDEPDDHNTEHVDSDNQNDHTNSVHENEDDEAQNNFKTNFGQFRMDYIKHVNVHQDSIRKTYIPHVKSHVYYQTPSCSTRIDSSSEDEDLDDYDEEIDSIGNEFLMLKAKNVDVQNNNNKETSFQLIKPAKNLIEPPKLKVAEDKGPNSSGRVIIQSHSVLSPKPAVTLTSTNIIPKTASPRKTSSVAVTSKADSSKTIPKKGIPLVSVDQTVNSKDPCPMPITAKANQAPSTIAAPSTVPQICISISVNSTGRTITSNSVQVDNPPENRVPLEFQQHSYTAQSQQKPCTAEPLHHSYMEQTSSAHQPERFTKRPWTSKAIEDLVLLSSKDSVVSWDSDEPSVKRQHRDSCSSTSGSFKVPLKRPPTRKNSVSPRTELPKSVEVPNQKHEDDLISIFAETLNVDADENCTSEYNVDLKRHFVQNWLANNDLEAEVSHDGTSGSTEPVPAGSSSKSSPGQRSPVFPPAVFKGLCFYHFFQLNGKRCYITNCTRIHDLQYLPSVMKNMQGQPEDRLLEAYIYARDYPDFYVALLPKFFNAFAVKGMVGQMLLCVEHIFDDSLTAVLNFSRTSILVQFMNSSKICYGSPIRFVQILIEKCLDRIPNLGDVLTEVLITRQDVPLFWQYIKKIILAKKLSQHVAVKLLEALSKSPKIDKKIAQDVLHSIKRLRFVDINTIPPHVIYFFEAVSALDASPNVAVNNRKDSPILGGAFGSRPVFGEPLRNIESFGRNQPLFGDLIKTRNEDFGSLFKSSERTSSEHSFGSLNRTNEEPGNRMSSNNEWRNTSPVDFPDRESPRFSGNEERRNAVFDSLRAGPSRSWTDVDERASNATVEQKLNFEPPDPEGWARRTQPHISRPKLSKHYIKNGPHYDPILDYVDGSGASNNVSPYHVGEAVVSSSSDVKTTTCQKPPEHPKFGQMKYDPHYEFNVSLHNFYLQQLEAVDINEDDVLNLNDAVKCSDGKVFLELLYKYKNPKTIKNFITMTIAHLRGMNQMIASKYEALLCSIEREKENYYGDLTIRVTLEVITMNLLFELDQRVKHKEAQKLLERFSDWDSLISSRLFFISKAVSLIGRILFIAKLLCNVKPALTFEILHTPRLRLLESNHSWPYNNTQPTYDVFEADLKFRNEILLMFLKEGYKKTMSPVTQFYKIVFAKQQVVYNVNEDFTVHFDNMLVDLINKNAVTFLKQIQANIDIFGPKMERETLRAYICCMYSSLGKPDVFKLYEKAVQKGIYDCVCKGETLETEVLMKTNFLDIEIEMIILYYFYKLTEFGLANDNLKFIIRPPGRLPSNRLSILKTVRSLSETQKAVRSILLTRCSIESNCSVQDEVRVDKTTLWKYLDENRG